MVGKHIQFYSMAFYYMIHRTIWVISLIWLVHIYFEIKTRNGSQGLLWVGGLCLLIRDFFRTAWLHGDDVGGANGDGIGGDSEDFGKK